MPAKILIVEDEGIEALSLQQKLKIRGYNVPEIVYTGEDAVKKTVQISPDLVLMDIMLHGEMDGITAAEKIHASSDIPIIYITAYADDETLKRAKITEPYGYIVKPFKERELQISIEMALYKHRAERELKESRKLFETTLKSIVDGVIATDKTGLIKFMNPIAGKLTGWKQEDVLNKELNEVFKIINRQTRRPAENPVTRALEGFISCRENNTLLIAKDGKEIPIDTSAAPIKDDDGNSLGVILVFCDVTKREKMQAALQKAHDELEIRVQERTAQLQEVNKALQAEIEERKKAEKAEQDARVYAESIVETLRESLVVLDAQLRVVTANQTFYNTFKVSLEETENKFIYDLGNHQWDIPELRKLLEEIIPKNTQFQDFEIDNEFQNIGHRTMLLNARRIYQSDDNRELILLAIEDITEKKNIEAHLLRAQRMESIGTLAGGIAHDLNNVLTPIMLSLHMLKDKFKDEQSQKLLTILEKNSERSASLVKQVLSFSRGVEGERNPLEAKHIIIEIEKMAKETFPRNIEIRTDIQKDLFTISGDSTQLHQVIMNLCVNARDAMPDGGVLNITASNFLVDENHARMHTEAKLGSYVAIAVSDNGIGIPSKIMDRIFEPFFTTKEFGKGTGLGLSTALAIVKSHGGFINVQSEVGKGSTFMVYLPAIKTEMQNVEEQHLELLTGQGELVLVAEDEDSVREVTVSTLEKYGYSALTANDGATAVALYAKNKDKVEVILMDMMMPVMDGQSSIRAIRKISPEVKIIAVSGLAEKDKLKNVAGNTNAFLPKPYTAERLLKAIHEVIGTG